MKKIRDRAHYMPPPLTDSDFEDTAYGKVRGGGPPSPQDYGYILLGCAFHNELERARDVLETGQAPIDFVDPETGLTALHIAVGRNHSAMASYLVEHGAAFLPDHQGRMPSTIAAECEVSDEMCDFIAEAEAKADGV
jgi:uncharacterized protein